MKGSSVLQSSTWSSLSAINTLVDEVFPAVQEMLHVMRGASSGMRAAAHAAVGAERLRAAAAARASSTGGDRDAAAAASAGGAAASAGGEGPDGEQQREQDGEKGQAGGQREAGGPSFGGHSPPASEAGSVRSSVRLLAPSAVGPQRDEFNDAQ